MLASYLVCSGLGIPVKLLHEAEGHVVTCELVNGEMYRGKLVEAEDNMNALFVDVQYTDRSGKTSHLESVYIRGSKIRYFVLPDMLKHAPMFKNMKKAGAMKGGKTAVLRAQALAQAKKR
jgi:small nuclear ribonucleoprotein D3